MDETAKQSVLKMHKRLDWGLCIFFSVDLEEATAYKVQMRSRSNPGDSKDSDWCEVFETFYRDFPDGFFKNYTSLSGTRSTEEISDPTRPDVWKFVGDEILFFAPLSDARQTLEHVNAFAQTIIDYNNNALREKPVKCKGTVWIAGMPVNNRVIDFGDFGRNDSGYVLDFIGSSIDCGFRLTKFSSPRRLVLSLDLLWMLCVASQGSTSNKYAWFRSFFRFHGNHVLKGVFSGKPYPVFWLDLAKETSAEDRWQLPNPCEQKEIISFCERTSKNMKPQDFMKPFIANDKSKLFSDIPQELEEQRIVVQGYERYKEEVSGDSTEEREREISVDPQPSDSGQPSPEVDKYLDDFRVE